MTPNLGSAGFRWVDQAAAIDVALGVPGSISHHIVPECLLRHVKT